MNNKITAIVQARFNSQRLPGKVLLPLGGKTILEIIIDRIRKAKSIDKVVLATSGHNQDDQIADLCIKKNILFYRGSLDDVLDRYMGAAKKFKVEVICRITGDCPLIDPLLIDQVSELYQKGSYDYISTGRIKSTFPDGLDTEIFSFEVLERAWRESTRSSEREHVTPYIWKNPDKFRIFTLENQIDLSDLRLTVDERADYELIKKIYPEVKDLSFLGVIEYIKDRPELAKINSSITRDEGYFKSLASENF